MPGHVMAELSTTLGARGVVTHEPRGRQVDARAGIARRGATRGRFPRRRSTPRSVSLKFSSSF